MCRLLRGVFTGFLYTVFVTAGGAPGLMAQQAVEHHEPTAIPSGQIQELEFRLSGISSTEVFDASLFYRTEGDIAFEQTNVEIFDERILTEIRVPGMDSGSLEYYLSLEMNDGSRETYPAANPESDPISVTIVEARNQDTLPDYGHIDYNILSPQPEEEVAVNDVIVGFTMFYEQEPAQADSFTIYFGGEDVTSEADISPFFISYVPSSVPPGRYPVEIIYEEGGDSFRVAEWSFTVRDRSLAEERERQQMIPQGRIELDGRNQNVSGYTHEIYRGRLQFSGNLSEDISYSFNGLLTNQESSRRQTRNRFGGEFRVGEWLDLQGGHVYPSMNSLMITGRRIYGINGKLNFFNDNLQIEGLYGNLARTVTNRYSELEFYNEGEQEGFALGFDRGGRGTYERKITAGRLAFGSGRTFQLGLNALKVEDNIGSLHIIDNYDDLTQDMLQSLPTDERQQLQQNPELFEFQGNHPDPVGNFIFATDISANAHDNRINLNADAGVSLVNNDISDGRINQERAEELGFDLDEGTDNVLDRLSTLIVINENMNTLPLQFEDGEAEPFVPSGIFGFRSRMNLNYFNNNLEIRYRWIGPDYESMANSSIRRDIAGFRITDRFRMLDNTLYVTLGYENLNDNVINNRDATTDTDIFRGNISWYPVSRSLPRVSVNGRYQTRDNDIERYHNPYLEQAGIEQNRAVRNVNFTDTPLLTPRPRLANTTSFGFSVSQEFDYRDISHNASVNLNTMQTSDEVFAYGDFSSNSFSLDLSSRFQDLPLRVNLRANYNQTESVSGLNTVDITGGSLGGTYRFLDDQLSVRTELALTKNDVASRALTVSNLEDPTELEAIESYHVSYYEPGNEVREETTYSYLFRANVNYDITANHAVALSARYNNLVAVESGRSVPNDQYIQARYVFSF